MNSSKRCEVIAQLERILTRDRTVCVELVHNNCVIINHYEKRRVVGKWGSKTDIFIYILVCMKSCVN